jgi:hypothetical protein
MSFTTDFFLADPATVAATPFPKLLAQKGRVEASGVSDIEMEAICDLLLGEESVEIEDVESDDEDVDALLFRLPDALTQFLADSDEDALGDHAETIAEAEEWEGATTASVTSLLTGLAALARESRQRGQAIFFAVRG